MGIGRAAKLLFILFFSCELVVRVHPSLSTPAFEPGGPCVGRRERTAVLVALEDMVDVVAERKEVDILRVCC